MEHLKQLNEAQKQAVLTTEGPLLIIAGAGAGKTKTITHRMVQQVCQAIPPDRLLAVTFTNKAASEMRERTLGLLSGILPGRERPPLITTFHSLSVRLLRELGSYINIDRSFVIWDRDDSMRSIKQALKELGLEHEPRKILGSISRAKGEGTNRSTYTAQTRSFSESTVASAWERYDRHRAVENALDFDDLLLRALELLNNIQARTLLQNRWTHLTIDEYQDTNAVQYELAKLLTGDAKNICAVGDLDQCIYTWRQARLENLLHFEKSFPGTQVIMLEQNYRSTQTILTAANAIIAKNKNRHPKNLFTNNPTGEAISIAGHFDEQGEARYVANNVRELLGSGIPAAEIAVLYRENFQSRALEEQLIRQGIPYRVLGVRFFERAEVKDILAYLRAALNPKSKLDVTRAAGSPSRGLGKTTLEKWFTSGEDSLPLAARNKVTSFRNVLGSIRMSINEKKPSETIQHILITSGLEKALQEGDAEDHERLQNIRELVSLAVKYDSLPPLEGIEQLIEDAALMSEQDSLQEKKDAVSLMTVHASKGLEFEAVFITGLEQGLFPSIRHDDARDPEEERRLFYVAITRAKQILYLTYATARMKYGTREYTTPSEFLDDIDSRLVKIDDAVLAPSHKGQKRGILDLYEDEDTIR